MYFLPQEEGVIFIMKMSTVTIPKKSTIFFISGWFFSLRFKGGTTNHSFSLTFGSLFGKHYLEILTLNSFFVGHLLPFTMPIIPQGFERTSCVVVVDLHLVYLIENSYVLGQKDLRI